MSYVTQRQKRSATGESFVMLIQGLLYASVVAMHLRLVVYVTGRSFTTKYEILATLAFLLSIIAFRRFTLLQPWDVTAARSEGTSMLMSWTAVVGLLLIVGYAIKYTEPFSREVILIWFLTTPLVLFVFHGMARKALVRLFPPTRYQRKAVVVFVNSQARMLAEKIKFAESSPFRLVGYFEDRTQDRVGSIEQMPCLGRLDELKGFVDSHQAEVVFIVLPDNGTSRALDVLDILGDTTASVYYVPNFYVFDLISARIGEIEGIPVLEVTESPIFGVDGFMKRCFDVMFSLFALALTTPVMLVIALIVKLTSRGPILFKQRRYGLHGEEIWVHKFRSMRVMEDGDEVRQATREDDRITPIGRFLRRSSMDELPQFLNVLKGEMSVVGPRPHAVAHNELYRHEVKSYMVRHKVKPGITGWAQVNGYRGETQTLEKMQKRVEYDLEYIRSWSLALDISIVYKTIMVIFNDRNAY